MRPIDADKIEFLGLNNRVCPDLSAMDVIDEQPTVDAVPVVRCFDCQYRNTVQCPAYRKLDDTGEIITPQYVRFCSYGERKDGEK
ncbi:hypothetical protein EQM14_01560 [Caproiciproducens sp. NJN-50]|uniref:hypothetical protein n=1 Tax=Caproiciproducens sp. NJN-50 TaxID=2507162 RepID=UPI000FFDFC78|nr:hypothetical protein [Caproiciproducens sp. NJN-50]QAT48571.1 hypothetical protein EQM14_01560 [Caproiciproducens sp. NJN-50]